MVTSRTGVTLGVATKGTGKRFGRRVGAGHGFKQYRHPVDKTCYSDFFPTSRQTTLSLP